MVRITRSPRAISLLLAVCMVPLAPGSVRAEPTTDTTVPSSETTPATQPRSEDTVAPATSTTVPQEIVPAFLVPPVRALPGVRIGSAVIVLDEQRVYVYSRTRRLIATIPVSTGLDDTTPTGSFRVFSKSALAFYSPNPGERMRWMVRFTKGRQGDNIGFHGIPFRVTAAGEKPLPTPVGQAPSSHGCIRTREAEAKWLFENMSLGTPVRVVRSRNA